MIAEKSCYQLILDKKSIENILNLDFNSELNNSSYHFIDSYESRIAERHIWFIQNMNISNNKKQTTTLCARNHYEWKRNATHIYAAQCKKYVENRIQWKWELVKVVINSSGLKWSSVTFSDKVLRLTNSERIYLSKDLRQMMKEKDNVKWVFFCFLFLLDLAVADCSSGRKACGLERHDTWCVISTLFVRLPGLSRKKRGACLEQKEHVY